MSSFPLFTLHWGLVNRSVVERISGVTPRGKVLKPIKGVAVNKGVGGGSIKKPLGKGSTPIIKGRSRVKTIKGGGRIC